MKYRPQLAELVKVVPQGDEWLHEIKYDGFRIGCLVERGKVTLVSRNGKDWTAAFPEICRAALGLGVDSALVDGEVAMLLPDGRTSFQALQNASGGSRAGLVYFAFDLLHAGGEDLSPLPLEERKSRLAALLRRSAPGKENAHSRPAETPSAWDSAAGGLGPPSTAPSDGRLHEGRIRYSEHLVGNGQGIFDEACRLGLEGIVSKKRGAPYRPGRSSDWVKAKCVSRQEMVIGGFTDPEGSREGIGALLVGFYGSGRRLTYAGKVGTGFTRKTAAALRERLGSLARPDSPFDPPPPGALARRAHWVEPELVAEVTFSEWTAEGRLRHPAYVGLREDREARTVGREEPVSTKATGRHASGYRGRR